MISEEKIYEAAVEAAEVMNAGFPESGQCEHEFTPTFKRRMKKLIRKTNHPALYHNLKRVVCFLALLAICGGTVLVFNVEVRAEIWGWVKEQYESFVSYHFPNATETSMPSGYRLGWVPSGYLEKEEHTLIGNTVVIYVNKDGTEIQLSYSNSAGDTTLFVEDAESEKISGRVNDNEADLYISKSPNMSSGIVWTDSKTGTLFFISAQADVEELIKMAEHVEIQK